MDIPLGTANSKLYEKNGLTYYKISPIIGMQINFSLDVPITKLKITGSSIVYDSGFYKLKLLFKDSTAGTYKVRIKPSHFWCIPFGTTFCEISKSHKELLFGAITSS